jgi:hypothetical protein
MDWCKGIDRFKEINLKLYLNGQDIQKTSRCNKLKIISI